tara:strand:- start:2542 stop:4800 length:2259 start_codon:yes stop_codon:yes gene_type:complete
MGHKVVRIFDSFQVSPPEEYLDLGTREKIRMMDSYISGVRKLNVTVAASHAGRITRNHGLYLPSKMAKGARTLLSRKDGGTSAYSKPVLLNHDRGGGGLFGGAGKDPIGRIRAAEYVETPQNVVDQTVRDYLQDMAVERPFYQFVDIVEMLMSSRVLYDKDFGGVGYLRSTAEITDPDAIEKFMDGRYQTVSTSATTNRAVCSICREDWAELGEPCEHRPGEWYSAEDSDDKDKCFLIAGEIVYDEWSVATIPADDEAIVLAMDGDVPGSNIIRGVAMDSYEPYELSMGVQFKDNFDLNGGPSMKTREEMLTQLKELWPQDHLGTFDKIDDSVSDDTISSFLSQEHPDALTLDDVVQAFDFKIDNEGGNSDPVNPEDCAGCGGGDNTGEGGEDPLTIDDWEKIVDKMLEDNSLTEDEADILYEMMANELSDMAKEIIVTNYKGEVEDCEDAKLSAGQRKKLSSGTFCGPDRSFPVNDCPHYVAAKRLIGRYKGPGDKAKILACVERKGRALGCQTKKKDVAPEPQDTAPDFQELLVDFLSKEDNDAIRDLYMAVEAEVTDRQIIAEPVCRTCPEKDQAIADLTTQKDELDETLTATREELELARQDTSVLMEQLTDSHTAQKDLLVSTLAFTQKLNGEKDGYVEIRDGLGDKTLSELKNNLSKLHGDMDFDNMTLRSDVNETPDPVSDPTLSLQDEHTPASDTEYWVPQVVKRYNQLREDSRVLAEGYLMDMKRKNFVPADFDIKDFVSDDE